MTKWRSVSALVVLGSMASIAACATATNNGVPGGTAGISDGTAGAPSASGGSPAGGSAQAGSPSATAGSPGAGAPSATAGAATGGSSTGGSATGGSSTGGSATAGAATGGSAGHAGAVGTAGAATGGSSGTSSGGGPPTDGDGGVVTGACADPIELTSGTSIASSSAVCARTADVFNFLGCSNFGTRTLSINGTVFACSQTTATKVTATPIGGYIYFQIGAGTPAYASMYWYK